MTPLEKLRKITLTLLEDARPAYTLRSEVLELRPIFEEAGGLTANAAVDIATGETKTDRGVAISPTMAAMCLDDFARTVQFIRGIHAAINERSTGSPVRVLYAGCGPWATLAVPLMSVFDRGQVRFTLIDLHEESIRSAERIIRALGLDDHVDEFVVADASEYRIADNSPDVIVVEMLRAALASEPQVAVVRHLSAQTPDALMIPQQVRIDLTLVNASRELAVGDSAVERDRIAVGTVFDLDRSTDAKPIVVTVPEFDERRYQPMLLTTVRIYADYSLTDYDSGITLPKKIDNIAAGNTVEFAYEIGARPRLTARVIDKAEAFSRT